MAEELIITEEVVDRLYDVWGKHDVVEDDMAEYYAINEYPNINPLHIPSIFIEFMRDNPPNF